MMSATPTSKTADDGEAAKDSGMGLFANVFDAEETFEGKLAIDTDTGKISGYNETLTATYVAAEMPRNPKPGKGPDVLTIVLTYSTDVQAVK